MLEAQAPSPEASAFNARVAGAAGALEHSVAASSRQDREALTRLESAYATDAMRARLRVGDAVSSPGMWSTALRFGGIQYGTRSAPPEDTSAQLARSGLAVLPTAEDALFTSVDGSSGTFSAQNLSTDGSLPWQHVAEDTGGHSQGVDEPVTARAVEPSCADISAGLGKVRRDYGLSSNEYGPLFAHTTVACAAPRGWTLEGHAEYLVDEVAALGVGVARPLGTFGTASVALASSRGPRRQGWLARFGFEHRNSLFDFSYRSRQQSREFRQVGTAELSDTIAQRRLASLSIHLTETARLSLIYADQTSWGHERTNLVALQHSVRLGRGILSMGAGHSIEDDIGSSFFLSYQRPLGRRRAGSQSPVRELNLGLLHRRFVE